MPGSSPRVWGTLRLELARLDQMRFIPTGVGNTLIQDALDMPLAVHPHGCGEHSIS